MRIHTQRRRYAFSGDHRNILSPLLCFEKQPRPAKEEITTDKTGVPSRNDNTVEVRVRIKKTIPASRKDVTVRAPVPVMHVPQQIRSPPHEDSKLGREDNHVVHDMVVPMNANTYACLAGLLALFSEQILTDPSPSENDLVAPVHVEAHSRKVKEQCRGPQHCTSGLLHAHTPSGSISPINDNVLDRDVHCTLRERRVVACRVAQQRVCIHAHFHDISVCRKVGGREEFAVLNEYIACPPRNAQRS
mmetsp:Transcript_22570/g.44663  ORF Transcript_22570/g.44663 Transcript_22570/m.44663 type:complete len:246 (-) Transcript_22570:626-1363(-)